MKSFLSNLATILILALLAMMQVGIVYHAFMGV
jgi:hypothetical protein